MNIQIKEKSEILFTYLGMDFGCLYGYLKDDPNIDIHIDELKTILSMDIDKDILKAVNRINKEYHTDIRYTLEELKDDYNDLTNVIHNYLGLY